MRTIEMCFVAYEYVTVEVSEEEFEALENGEWVEAYDRAYEGIETHCTPDWELDETYNDNKGYLEC